MGGLMRLKSECREKIHKKITILHCTSQYPAISSDLNILSIKFLKDKLGLDIGFSDHSLGNTAAIMSVALGAKVIEKHITLNNNKLDLITNLL